jgi:hypothetical protein
VRPAQGRPPSRRRVYQQFKPGMPEMPLVKQQSDLYVVATLQLRNASAWQRPLR